MSDRGVKADMRWRRRAAGLMLCSLLLVNETVAAAHEQCDSWPAWKRFKQLYLSEDGRVIDASSPRHVTVSEGQAYALFFALVANDPQTFGALLQWTTNNLAQGDLTRTLPAWQWGRDDDGTWHVLDSNAAADADLWIAYTLGEAGRLWRRRSYVTLGRALASRILQHEVALIPELGATLLPAPKGFIDQHIWRLNPSYVPLQIVRGISRQTNDPLWSEIAQSSEQLILASAPRGFAADWIEYHGAKGFATDRATGGVGSYNAIRVYLWAGMLTKSDPAYAKLARKLAPMVENAAGRAAPVEKINTNTLAMTGSGAPGFSAALLPMLHNAGLREAVQVYRTRVQTQLLKSNQQYFSDALSLFGLGWLEDRYRFGSSGRLAVGWKQPCKPASSS